MNKMNRIYLCLHTWFTITNRREAFSTRDGEAVLTANRQNSISMFLTESYFDSILRFQILSCAQNLVVVVQIEVCLQHLIKSFLIPVCCFQGPETSLIGTGFRSLADRCQYQVYSGLKLRPLPMPSRNLNWLIFLRRQGAGGFFRLDGGCANRQCTTSSFIHVLHEPG